MFEFYEPEVTAYDEWRSIILFGRNVATYKFALAKSLLEVSQSETETLTLDELAEPFSRHICKHLEHSDKQITSASSRFLDACRSYNQDDITKDELIHTTVRFGFANVIDAFHVVGQSNVSTRFFLDERTGSSGGIRLTEDFYRLRDSAQFHNLNPEVEARWRLVETAWSLRMPKTALTVEHESDTGLLVPNKRLWKRQPITAARHALNGYQKGHCFYCSSTITVEGDSETLADVDHFFPHVLKPFGVADPVDGVWNLVLACQNCNRGPGGKFDRLPTLRYLERLHARNSYLINSHHPLRETLQAQTGKTEKDRRAFLQRAYSEAKPLLLHTWKPAQA